MKLRKRRSQAGSGEIKDGGYNLAMGQSLKKIISATILRCKLSGKWHRRLFNSFLICVAILILTFLLFQPTLTEAARNEVGESVFFASYPPFITTHFYELQPLVVELENFTDTGGAIEPLGDNLLLVTPRGRIALIDADGSVGYYPQRVPLNESASADTSTWIGFRVADVLLHEQLPDRFKLLVSHHYLTGECVEFRISSTLLSLDQGRVTIADNWKTEFTANPCIKKEIFGASQGEVPRIGGGIQAGGRMLMDGAEHLLVFIGDHKWYEWHEQQQSGDGKKSPVVDPDYHLGRLVRIELASDKAEIVADGFRNPQGFARDADGNLWQTEHGPDGGDELNLLKPDLDYGWPYVSYGLKNRHKVWPYNAEQGRHDGFEEPVFAWMPSIGISSLIVSDSEQFPLWRNDLLIGSLKGQSLFRVRLRQGHVKYVEKIEIGRRIRDISQMPDGRIALLSDYSKVLFLQRAPIYCQDQRDVESIYTYDADVVCKDVSRIIKEADDPLVRAIDSAKVDNPVIRSIFNVYIHEDRIVYVKSPCAEHDLSQHFLLHITPAYAHDLSEDHKQLGVNVHDFDTSQEDVGSAFSDDVCVVVWALPDYEIERIYTGQAIRLETSSGEISWKGPVWDGAYTFDEPTFSNNEIASLIAQSDDLIIRSLRDIDLGPPVIRSLFNIHFYGNWLLYTKGRCSKDDLSRRFFLHITPVHSENLEEEHKQHGFNVYDFYSSDNFVGAAFNENGCTVAHVLPQYEIKQIYTGQVIRVESPDGEVSWKGPVWDAKFSPGDLAPGDTTEEKAAPSAYTDEQGTHLGASLFASRCASCHNLVAEHDIGPHLENLIGRRAGRVAGFTGSAALTTLDIFWTRENLAEFIANPLQFSPGTTMPDAGVTAEEAQIIAEFLTSEN